MLKTEEIQAFVHIVEAMTVTDAAERLGVAKSAVSRRLAELELQLGAELFHRTTRKLVLTETGQGFYNRCIRILADLEEAQHAVSQAHQELSGQLRVAAPLSFGVMHLGPAIIEFQKRHPKLNFDIDFNDRQIDLIQEGFDLGIRIAQLQDSSLMARKLATISSVICASPGYIKQFGVPATPAELTQHACLTYSYQANPTQWTFINNQGEEQTVKISRLMQANNGFFLGSAAIADLGILRLPRFIAYESIAKGELIPIMPDYRVAEVNAYAIYPPTRHLSQRVRQFIDFLAERFAGTPCWEKV
ncbi:MAG: LysR family transcriptional regulator [Gammaproteobacteria bacterium]|jgi:DNA-binding transcriptional LysR family regulator|nr:LysR family transcriptional regulator [Gammaproteobacteria bacterium]